MKNKNNRAINLPRIHSMYKTNYKIPDFKGNKYTTGCIAVVGQDAGITTSSKVNSVLMLNDSNSRLYRYVSNKITGCINRKIDEIVAFNLIKYNFTTSIKEIAHLEGYNFYELFNVFAHESFSDFLSKIDEYKPKCIITLGKPTFQFLCKKIDKNLEFKECFASKIEMSLNKHHMTWMPCVHMNTYNIYRRVYGKQDKLLESLSKDL